MKIYADSYGNLKYDDPFYLTTPSGVSFNPYGELTLSGKNSGNANKVMTTGSGTILGFDYSGYVGLTYAHTVYASDGDVFNLFDENDNTHWFKGKLVGL